MWTNTYAEALGAATTAEPRIVDEDAVLDFTRRVAHGSERKNAPLATFLAGWYVGARVAEGVSPEDAWAEAERLGDELL